MSKKKNKDKRFEKMLAGIVGTEYPLNRKLKDIDCNNRHHPKGKR